jgi:hypothetical protein
MNGKILIGKRVEVKGSMHQGGYNDTFDWLIPVEFNVPITEELISKAQKVLASTKWYNSHTSSWGALRWLQGRSLKDIEVVKDEAGNIIDVAFIVTERWGLCD